MPKKRRHEKNSAKVYLEIPAIKTLNIMELLGWRDDCLIDKCLYNSILGTISNQLKGCHWVGSANLFNLFSRNSYTDQKNSELPLL
jgi:hypothetical protein